MNDNEKELTYRIYGVLFALN